MYRFFERYITHALSQSYAAIVGNEFKLIVNVLTFLVKKYSSDYALLLCMY